MHELTVTKYEREYKTLWDEFIRKSKNGTFLLNRDYMEYHSDRFIDHSLLFFQGEKLVSVMPANVEGETLFSHGGLTYGGVISDDKMRTPLMIEIFEALKEYLLNIQINRIIYKVVPHIYHTIPAEEDLYALFRNNAKLIRRDVSSTIKLKKKIAYSKGRKWCVQKGRKNNLVIRRNNDFHSFMNLVKRNLREKYGILPTHSASEIQILAERFPDNLKLYAIEVGDHIIAGVLIYESKNVAHAQYIASSDEGKNAGAPDLLIDYLVNAYSERMEYFDFGISTERGGKHLNEGLIQNKESFGARAVVYDTYEIDLVR